MFASSKRHEPEQLLNYAYHKGQLTVSQKWGVIKLIPKKDAEPTI